MVSAKYSSSSYSDRDAALRAAANARQRGQKVVVRKHDLGNGRASYVVQVYYARHSRY